MFAATFFSRLRARFRVAGRLPGMMGGMLLAGLLATGCRTARPRPPLPPDDLVEQARSWREQENLAAARDRLSRELAAMDAADGWLEKRLWQTNADPALQFPDSLAALPAAQRSRVGLFLVLGYQARGGKSERIIRHAAGFLASQGWHALLIGTPEHGTGEENAAAIQQALAAHLPQVDHAMLVGFSKGGLDLMHWYAGSARELPLAERRKLGLMVTCAGALRGAAVAGWLTDHSGWIPQVMCCGLGVWEGRREMCFPDLISTGADPWQCRRIPPLRRVTPRLESVSIVALPEGRDGFTAGGIPMALTGRMACWHRRWMGPVDGLVESAAEVLPPAAGQPQHIVRIFGSHALLDGKYASGGDVSATFRRDGPRNVRGGEEFLDDLLRAVPRRWVL